MAKTGKDSAGEEQSISDDTSKCSSRINRIVRLRSLFLPCSLNFTDSSRRSLLHLCSRSTVLVYGLRRSTLRNGSATMTRMKSPEAFLLRAEELRVIANQYQVPEIRNFLLGIAQEYEEMAGSANFVLECRDRLTAISQRFERPEISHSERPRFATNKDSSEVCRSLAADASGMATRLNSASREAWLQLAERWDSLADSIDRAN